MVRFLIFILLCSSIEGSEPFQPTSNGSFQIANLAGDPSAIVGGCVNVITGDFFDTQRDLFMVGGQPLILERSYSSSDFSMGGLSNGWHFNIQGVVDERVVKGPYGGEVPYQSEGMISPEIMHKGLSNNASGYLSGKTNLKNSVLNFNFPQSNNCILRHGDYSHSIFTKTDENRFTLTSDIKPNGMKLHYNYCMRGLESAFVANTMDERQQAITFAYPDNTSLRSPSHLRVYASDGRMITYTFQNFKYPNHHYRALNRNRDSGAFTMSEPKEEPVDQPFEPPPPPKPSIEGKYPRFYLSNVIRPNAPPEQYFYEEKNPQDKHLERVVAKWLPENRYIKISYYKSGSDGALFFDHDHPWLGRVRTLEGPVGTDGNPEEMYRFYYNCEDDKCKSGSCRVINALKQTTDYFWDSDKRLKRVIKGNLIDELYWGDGQDYSNLQSRTCSTQYETLFCKCYRYDAFGNVLNEWLYGNLSGHNSAPLIISSNGIPVETGCERIEKSYVYSNDMRNLLLIEQEGDRSKRYRYLPYSDLLEASFTFVRDKVVLRNSYRYDSSCNVIEETIDDGSSSDTADLNDVTFRKIRRIKPRETAPFGVPEIIEDYSLDLETNQECLLKMQVNHFSSEGRLIKQDHFDSERNYAFSLHWEYDAYGNVICETDALGHQTQRRYDANSNLIFEQGPRSDCRKEYFYDYSNRLIRIDEVHPERRLSTLFHYDKLGQKTSSIDCYGNETNYEYDEFSRVTKVSSPSIGGERGITEKVYDALGNVSHTIDPLKNITSASYNLRGKPVQILYPDGSSEHFSYYFHGPLAGKVERNGCTMHYRYDYQDRLIETKCCDPSQKLLWTTSASYNTFQLLSETDVSGNVTEYKYDIHGRKISTQCGNRLEEYEYDALSRLIKKSTHYGNAPHEVIVNTYRFDVGGRLIEESTEDAFGNTLDCTQYSYDSTGKRTHLIKHGQQGESVSEIRYDSFGMPREMIDAIGNVTYTYQSFTHVNAEGKYVAYQEVVDPLGNRTISIKDSLGRDSELLRKNAMGDITQKREIFYDLNNNKTKVVETVIQPEGSYQVTHTWQYDCMNQVVRCVEAEGSLEQKATSYVFNLFGQLQSIQKPSGVVIHHEYTSDGLLKEFSSSDQSIHYVFTYDSNRNLVESYDTLNKCFTKRIYDAYNQVVEEQLGNDLTLQFTYDATGRVKKLTLPDSSTVAYHYQSVLLKEIKRFSADNNELYSHSYDTYDLALHPTKETLIGKAGVLSLTYDKKDRIQSIVSKFTSELIPEGGYDAGDNLVKKGTSDAIGKVDACYKYDDLYQLVEEEGAEAHTYQFDSLHNRIAKDNTISSYNQLSQLIDSGYVYDADGRLVQAPSEQFAYDALDRLTSYTKDNNTTTYTYDSFNRRLTKTTGTKTWKYLYADQNDVGCYLDDKMIEFRVLGLGHGAEIGAAVAIELNGKPYAPIHDLNGNVTTLITSQGKVADTYRYTAFGVEITKPKLQNPWKFSSKRQDQESSLTYFGRRYYSPSLGRWLTPDPLAYQAGPNLYAYVSNNPLTDIDLYGLIGERECRTMPSAIYVKEVIHNTCERLRECTSRVRETISSVSDSISITADRVCNTIKNYSDSFLTSNLEIKSKWGTYEGINPYPKGAPGIMYIPGVKNDDPSTITMAAAMSEAHGGVSVDYVAVQTHGLISDLIKTIYMKLGFDNFIPVHECARMLNTRLKESVGDLWVYVSSQGATTFTCALKRVPEELHNRIKVCALGGATVIPKNKLKDCSNYWSYYDIITPLADLAGLIKSCVMKDKYKVEILKGEKPLLDHYFLTGPYFNVIRKNGDDYKEKY